MQNAQRWGTVTFCIGITCGVLGHFLPPFIAFVSVIIVALFGAIFGSHSVEYDK